MYIKTIKVNNFRALKDIHIDFETDVIKQIFPLGSLNGGGKSTLLQLMFTLIHCSASQDPAKLNFIQNLLAGFPTKADTLEELAAFTILDDQEGIKKEYCLRFYVCQNTYIQKLLAKSVDNPLDSSLFRFSSLIELQDNNHKIDRLQLEIEALEKSIRQIEKLGLIEDPSERSTRMARTLRELLDLGITTIPSIRSMSGTVSPRFPRNTTPEDIQRELQELLEITQINLYSTQDKSRDLKANVYIINQGLQVQGLNYVTNYASQYTNDAVLLYRVDGVEGDNTPSDVVALSRRIFLAAPSTQVYLFLSKKNRLSIFKTKGSQESQYFQALDEAKAEFGNFLSTYDFFETRFLIDLFTQARDEDFRCATESQGQYGDNYQKLVQEMNSILPGKKINVKVNEKGQISEVTFTMVIGSEERSLFPEDLSHGELKKLNLYTWLKTYQIKNAIVLMDEPEIALHPDWQYDLTHNLWDWEPSNQYILATHSYEICQPLTPRHVKEIEPKLFKNDN